IVLPQVFQSIPFGGVLAVVFFILLSIAALTSTVSLLEVVVAYLVDERGWSRAKAVGLIGGITFLVGLPSALSQGAWPLLSDLTPILGEGGFFGQRDFLSIMDFIWGNLALAFGALLISIFVGWVWTAKRASEELVEGSGAPPAFPRIWSVFIQF